MSKAVLILSLFFISVTAFAALPEPKPVISVAAQTPDEGEKIQFLPRKSMSVKDYEKVTGKKLNFFQKFVFGIEKKQIIRELTNPDKPSNFKVLGFAMGLLYGPFGLLAAYIFSKNANFRKSAFFGFKIWLVVLLVLCLVILALAGGKFK